MSFPRDLQPELMDDPDLPSEEHKHALEGLSRLNRFSGVIGGMFRQIRNASNQIQHRPVRLLDVASGSGDLPIAWAKRAKRSGLDLQITATDISPVAVDRQQQRARESDIHLESIQANCFEGLPRGFDLVTCSLFMHHLDEQQTCRLIQNMCRSANHAVVICDLDRSRLNYWMVGVASRLLTRSHVVHTDALLSVKNAYTRSEFQNLASSTIPSQESPVRVQRMFPCRFLLVQKLSGTRT